MHLCWALAECIELYFGALQGAGGLNSHQGTVWIFIGTSGSYKNVVLFLINGADFVCVWNYLYKLLRLAHRTT